MPAAKPIIVVGGSKGGVGKSLVAMVVVDWLAEGKQQPVVVLDGDNSNPDVAKVCKALDPEPRLLDLDVRDGWLNLSELCNDHADAHVVVNMGARSLRPLQAYSGSVLQDIHRHLGRATTMLWVIDDERDSVELLRSYLETVQEAGALPAWLRLHVVCNAGQDEHRSFALYEGTDTARQVAQAGGAALRVSMLAKRVTTLLYTGRLPIAAVASGAGADGVSFSARIEMERWRREAWAELEKAGLTGR